MAPTRTERRCPEVQLYQRLAAGELADAEKEALLGHLEGCDACGRKLASLPAQDTLVDLLKDKGFDIASGAGWQRVKTWGPAVRVTTALAMSGDTAIAAWCGQRCQ